MPIAPADFATRALQQAGNASLVSLAAEDFATATKQDTGNGTLASILAKIIAAPATEATLAAVQTLLTTWATSRVFARYTQTWVANDGTVEVEIAVPAGNYWCHAVAHQNAVAAGSATYRLHASTETGFTPGANDEEFYTSTAALVLPTGVYDGFVSAVPIIVGVAAKVYVRVVPDAGSTTGSVAIFLTPNV